MGTIQNIKEGEKGRLVFKYLPIKFVKCPYCGAFPIDYHYNQYSKWGESVDYECGFGVQTKSCTTYTENSLCKKSKEYKKLKGTRLAELQKILDAISKHVKDEKLFREMILKMSSIESNIKDWW